MTDGEAFTSISGSGDDFGQIVTLCEQLGDYCLIGGLAINAYVKPVYTMVADFVLAAAQLALARPVLAAAGFVLEDFPHSLKALRPGSLAEVPARSAEAEAMSKARLKRSFKFVGPTICYALMQAVGMVNYHCVDCPRWRALGGRA
jgi:Methyladenine glycosylase